MNGSVSLYLCDLCFENPLNRLDTSSLLARCFVNIFSQSVICLFILLRESFTGQKFFLVWCASIYQYFSLFVVLLV